MNNVIRAIEKENMREDLPILKVGDTVKVYVKVIEGTRERLQSFEGYIIAKKGGGIRESITVRRVSFGIGIERTFPLHSPKIAKIEGAYHGLYDFAEVSQTSKPENWGDSDRPESVPVAHGTPSTVLDQVVVIPFNDPETAVSILNEHGGDIVCVLVDPMPHRVGLVPADTEFVQRLREWTLADGALLVFDEVITFRTEFGGFQDRFHVKPDLTALGKMIGGGFPVGAIAGSRDVMQVMNPLTETVRFPHSGTFSANPITMTAGLTAMSLYDEAAVQRLNSLTLRAVEGIREAIGRSGEPACVTGSGSMFRVHLKPQPPRNHREAFTTTEEAARLAVLLDHLFDEGFLMINTCSATLSTAMAEAEIDSLVDAVDTGLQKLSS